MISGRYLKWVLVSVGASFFVGCPGLEDIEHIIDPHDVEFTGSPSSGHVPLAVQFTDLSENGSGVILFWRWEFGNGSVSTEQNPLYVYELPGTYDVSLTVWNNVAEGEQTKDGYVTALSSIEGQEGEGQGEFDVNAGLDVKQVAVRK